MVRISNDDLLWAAQWVSCYDDDEDEPGIAAKRDRVVAWLTAEADRRGKEAAIRAVAKETGRKASEIRTYLKQNG